MKLRISPAVVLSAAISLTGLICYLATLSHGTVNPLRATLVAVVLTLMGTIPPLSFRSLLSKAPASHLAVTMWRVGILIPAFVLLKKYTGDERNCFILALLACYFVALPLESWLLIHQVKRDHHSSP